MNRWEDFYEAGTLLCSSVKPLWVSETMSIHNVCSSKLMSYSIEIFPDICVSLKACENGFDGTDEEFQIFSCSGTTVHNNEHKGDISGTICDFNSLI